MSNTTQDQNERRLLELEERLQALCDRYNSEDLDTKWLCRAVEDAIEGFTPTKCDEDAEDEFEVVDDEEDGL